MGLKEKPKTAEFSEQDAIAKSVQVGKDHIAETTHEAPIATKEKLNTQATQLLNDPENEDKFKEVAGTYADYYETVAKNDSGKFNALRIDAGLKPVHVDDPKLIPAVANELAVTVLKEALRRQDANITWLKEIEKIKQSGDIEGAKELEHIREGALKTKNKNDWDTYVQQQKTRLIEEGKTDLASSLGEVQETSNSKWSEMSNWKTPSVLKDLIPAILAKHTAEYASKLMKNIDEYLKEHLKKSMSIFDGKAISEDEKKTMAHELDEAQKEKKKLEEKGGNEKELKKNFEKHLKVDLKILQENVTDENVLNAVKKLNSNISKLDSADLMLENMYPSVAVTVVKAYRKAAVDTARAMT